MPSKIVIAGGSGFLGRILSDHLADTGYEVTILSRTARVDHGQILHRQWDGQSIGDWTDSLEDAEAVINLSGRTVNCRYNERNKKEIYDSRTESTRVIGEAIARCKAPPSTWINASSATIYRYSVDKDMDETNGEQGAGFSVDVCQKWEQVLFNAMTPGVRKIAMRISLVLANDPGSAYQPFATLTRWGLGGTIGNGRQMTSWIHHEDLCRSISWILDHKELEGPINVTAPNPVSNREFMATFRRAFNKSFGLPAMAWMVEIGTFLMRTESELVLKSRRVVPGKLLQSGFSFHFPNLTAALTNITEGHRL